MRNKRWFIPCVVYCATNKINGMKYIGATQKTLHSRYKSHYPSDRHPFSKALKEFGKNNFHFEVIRKCRNKSELLGYEDFYINKYKTKDRAYGYNGNWKRVKPTIETKCAPPLEEETKKNHTGKPPLWSPNTKDPNYEKLRKKAIKMFME